MDADTLAFGGCGGHGAWQAKRSAYANVLSLTNADKGQALLCQGAGGWSVRHEHDRSERPRGGDASTQAGRGTIAIFRIREINDGRYSQARLMRLKLKRPKAKYRVNAGEREVAQHDRAIGA